MIEYIVFQVSELVQLNSVSYFSLAQSYSLIKVRGIVVLNTHAGGCFAMSRLQYTGFEIRNTNPITLTFSSIPSYHHHMVSI